jgi:hypothetical protein
MDKASVIRGMNWRLAAEEKAILENIQSPEKPVLFIIGVPRSGTTLLAQLLIGRYYLGYIDNLIAKFWEAPVIGSCLALSLRGDRKRPHFQLASQFGFTAEYEGHHEFGYFWQRYFPFQEHHELEPDVLDKVDAFSLRREIAGMEAAWQAPMLFKNAAALPLQTAFLARALPTSVFLYIKRDVEAVAASLIKGRKSYSGAAQQWFSIKPRMYSRLQQLPVFEQIAGQIHYTQAGIEQQLAQVPAERQLSIDYHDLCTDPAAFFRRFENRMEALGWTPEILAPEIPELEPAAPAFSAANEQQQMREALKKWELCE